MADAPDLRDLCGTSAGPCGTGRIRAGPCGTVRDRAGPCRTARDLRGGHDVGCSCHMPHGNPSGGLKVFIVGRSARKFGLTSDRCLGQGSLGSAVSFGITQLKYNFLNLNTGKYGNVGEVNAWEN